MAQLLRILLPTQGTQVRSLVGEDPTCCGATKPACRNYWSPGAESLCSATREATATRSPCTSTKSSSRSTQLEKAHVQQRRPNTAKNKQKIKKKKKKREREKGRNLPLFAQWFFSSSLPTSLWMSQKLLFGIWGNSQESYPSINSQKHRGFFNLIYR